MYVIEHALHNLVKNKGRNILLGVIIFAIITATVVALAIFNTSGIVIEETKAALQSAVRVSPQKRAVTSGEQKAAVSYEQYRSFAESEYLDGANITENNRNTDGVEAVYYLKNPSMLSDFEAELRGKGLPDDYLVRTDESAFESVAAPVESLNSLSLTFLLIVLALGSVIMVLLSIISVRERKYEIGVLRAMGMKKKKVAFCLWTEIIAITCVCFIFGMSAGTILSQPISDTIMAGQMETSTTGSTSLADRLNGGETNENNQSEKIDIAVNGTTALQILGISLMLASIAGIISISNITKSEPIKILMERN